MRIAFDATVLHGRKSGIGYYCEELLKSMLATDHETDFVVFSHRPVRLDQLGANGNLRSTEDRHFPIRAVYLHALLPGVLDRVRPDLCHYTNFLAPIADSNPYVVTIHDMGLEVLTGCHSLAKRLYTRRLIPRVARNARLILTNSEYSKWQIVRHLGISEERIRITPLAASPLFRPVPKQQNGPAPYFLYVGNLEPRKNLERLLQAFATLKHLDHELWIVGNHTYRAGGIYERAKDLGIEERVRFPGYVPREELPGLYSGATAFVYPSLLEGFGLPVIEAMACGAPVITSDNSALKEVAGDAALRVNPRDVLAIARAMERFALEATDRSEFRDRGLKRAAEFSWRKTAELTLDAYREATGTQSKLHVVPGSHQEIADAIRRTVAYAAVFEYPLKVAELHERLFDMATDRRTFEDVLKEQEFPRHGDFISDSREHIAQRAFREAISDRAIEQVWPRLRGLAAFPYIRMLAFSGSTAHRNMTNHEDLDLFVVVEAGKLWATFLATILWARWRGVRGRFCMNYLVSDAALALFEHDTFTAQQVASLKPFYGKACYDRFIEMNPFVRRRFPNFEPSRHRQAYAEVPTPRTKRVLEAVLRCGPIQIMELASRFLLGWYLRRKARNASGSGDCDVLLEPQRLKLHLHSHKKAVLTRLG